MSSNNIPNELTTLKTEMQKDVEVNRVHKLQRKSQWIQVRVKSLQQLSFNQIKLQKVFSTPIFPSLSVQIACSLMANATVLSSGMGLGFPAITLEALTKENDPLRLDIEQASWFGKPVQMGTIDERSSALTFQHR